MSRGELCKRQRDRQYRIALQQPQAQRFPSLALVRRRNLGGVPAQRVAQRANLAERSILLASEFGFSPAAPVFRFTLRRERRTLAPATATDAHSPYIPAFFHARHLCPCHPLAFRWLRIGTEAAKVCGNGGKLTTGKASIPSEIA